MRRCWLILRAGKQEREDDINNEMLELRLITMTQKLSAYFPSRVCNVQADEYQMRPMRPPRPQPIAMWLLERLLPRRAQCELAIQASVGAYHISDEWSFGWHAMKIFVVLKATERRLLLGHNLESSGCQAGGAKASGLPSPACYDNKCLLRSKLPSNHRRALAVSSLNCVSLRLS
jgi:hypothetical protein